MRIPFEQRQSCGHENLILVQMLAKRYNACRYESVRDSIYPLTGRFVSG